jgi:hypothetical protein
MRRLLLVALVEVEAQAVLGLSQEGMATHHLHHHPKVTTVETMVVTHLRLVQAVEVAHQQ